MIYDANLPMEFWGYAIVHFVEVYNRTPHSSLGNKTPWECEKGTLPDVSMFRVFGCRATVYVADRPGLEQLL